jgi:protein involved in polysaccharide export with SLBB domain
VKGLFVSIETKAPGKHLTPRQEIVKAAIEAAGGVVFVVDSDATLDAAIEGIKRQLKLVYMRGRNWQ